MITSPDQLIEYLSKLPSQIRDQEKIVLELEEKVEQAKLEYEVAESQAILSAEKPNATEKKAYAKILTKPEKLNLIASNYDLKKSESELEYLNNRFIAIRKIVNLEQELIKSQLQGN